MHSYYILVLICSKPSKNTLGVRCAGADDAGVTGDGVFDFEVALGDFIGDGFKQCLTMFSIQQNNGCSLAVVYLRVNFRDIPIVA